MKIKPIIRESPIFTHNLPDWQKKIQHSVKEDRIINTCCVSFPMFSAH